MKMVYCNLNNIHNEKTVIIISLSKKLNKNYIVWNENNISGFLIL